MTMTAAERFKALFANAIERVCVLEEQLEAAQARVAELERDEIAARAQDEWNYAGETEAK